jgi:hypothetical protein
MSLLNTGQSRNESWTPYVIVVYQRLDFTSVYIINTISKWRNSLRNVCHPWLNNGVIYSCSALIPELLCYLLIRDIFLIMKLVNKLLYKYSLNDNLFRILELSWWCGIYICFLFYYVQSNRQMPMRAHLLSCYMHQNAIFPCPAIGNFIWIDTFLTRSPVL